MGWDTLIPLFHGVVLRGFANLRCWPNNKNTSFRPCSGQEHANCSSTRTGLWAIPHDVQEANGEEEEISSHRNVSVNKGKHYRILKYYFGGVLSVISGFSFFAGILVPNPHEKWGVSIIIWPTISAETLSNFPMESENMHEGIKTRFNFGNSCCHSVQSPSSYPIKTRENIKYTELY